MFAYPLSPLPLSSGRAYVTDDTQMTLALGEGLIEALAAGPLTADRMEPPVRVRFVEWWDSPQNNRAPGMTCLRACESLSRGGAWQASSQVGSKGCGANMRVAPVGLIPGLDPQQRSGAAQLQSALTHGHPTALAASGEGWIAEEALATGLYCFLLLPDDPEAVVRRAAYSSGDSDSIAALAGAFAGAYHGADAWPGEWARDIEYRDRLLALGAAWDG
jgi:ADP-ribosylglycohydrolase